MASRRWSLVLAVLLVLPAALGADESCPACGAPVEPGASFCTGCGRRLEGRGAAPPGPAAAGHGPVVQAIAAHDRLLTTAFGALMYGVKIEVPSMLGNAFAIAPGEFVTDASLLVGARTLTLRTPEGREVEGRVVGIDPLIGVGLVAADVPGAVPLALRLDPGPRLGEAVTARGYAADRGSRPGSPATLGGVVSGLHREWLGIHPIEDYVQTDATLPFGFAGAPLVDAGGAVVAMCTGYPLGRLVLMGPAGLGMAIPSAWLDRAVRWVRSGSPARPWLGLHVAQPGDRERERLGLPAEVRLVVEDVFPGGPASAAGIRRGDGLLRVRGRPVESPLAIHADLLDARPGETWSLDLVRGRDPRSARVALVARPDRPRLAPADTLRYFGGFELAARSEGLIVERVAPQSPAAASKVAPGDALQSLMSAKDLDRPDRYTARWRSVKDMADLERLVALAYSDFDFFIGAAFKGKNGQRKQVFLGDVLTPLIAL